MIQFGHSFYSQKSRFHLCFREKLGAAHVLMMMETILAEDNFGLIAHLSVHVHVSLTQQFKLLKHPDLAQVLHSR